MIANPSYVIHGTRKLSAWVANKWPKHLVVFALVSVTFEKEDPFSLEKPNGDAIWESTVDTEIPVCSGLYAGT